MGSNQFCLKWNNHNANMMTVFEELLTNEAFVDVTLVCECQMLKAHKLVLSACSPFFQSLFLTNPCKHPIIILKDMKYAELKTIIDFMYRGEVNVSHEQLSTLFKTAEALKVKGLTTENAEERTEIAQEATQLTTSNSQVISVGRALLYERNLSDKPESPAHRKRKARSTFHISDSNFADNDDHRPAKVKVSTSMDCVQDLRKDKSKSISAPLIEPASSDELHIQSLVHPSTVPNNSVQTPSVAVLNSQVSSTSFQSVAPLSVEEPEYIEASAFSEETSNADGASLVEKTPLFSESQSGQHSLQPNSPHLVTSNSDNFCDGDSHHMSPHPKPDTCLSTVVAAEPSSSCLIPQDTGQNIKTKDKDPFEEATLLAAPDSPYSQPTGSSTLCSETSVPSLTATQNSGSSSTSQEELEHSLPQDAEHQDTSLAQNEESGQQSTATSNSFIRPLCPYCRRIFYSPGNLKRHIEIHFLKRKNYICHICHKRFSWKNTLNSHLRRDHHLQV